MEKAVTLLKDYFRVFDDESITNEEMKNWLDNKWIPEAREFLQDVSCS